MANPNSLGGNNFEGLAKATALGLLAVPVLVIVGVVKGAEILGQCIDIVAGGADNR